MWIDREAAARELIDAPHESISIADYRAAARAVEWSNRAIDASDRLIRPLARMVRDSHLSTFTLLDVGCGVGDVDDAILNWARRKRLGATILGIDSSRHAVKLAMERFDGRSEASVKQIDFLEAKFSDGSFDFVVSSGVLHRLSENGIADFLWRAWRVARFGVVVVDLRRSLTAYLAARWILPVFAPPSDIFAHDAPLSIRRAFTPGEMRKILMNARLPYLVDAPMLSPFRMTLTAERPSA